MAILTSEVAPPPREVEDTRAHRSCLDVGAVGNKCEVEIYGGIRWRVQVGVRRLASTKKDVIELHWGIRYDGPRPPLHILRPALMDGYPDSTVALVSAIPKRKEEGREVKFTAPRDDPRFARMAHEGTPASFFVLEKDRGWATGTETISVAELKSILQTKYPDDFPLGCPAPSLYVDFSHNAWDRGGWLDCWTGELIARTLNVPDLTDW